MIKFFFARFVPFGGLEFSSAFICVHPAFIPFRRGQPRLISVCLFRREGNYSGKHRLSSNPDRFMEATNQRPSKSRIVLTWLLMVVAIVFFVAIAFWWNHRPAPAETLAEEPAGVIVHSVFYLFVGGFFLVAGVMSYLAVIFTGCFTFSYNQPVWDSVKTRKFIANIIVTVLLALGTGFMLAAFLGPVLTLLGLDAGTANMLPVMLMVVGIQIVQLWVLVWSPLEKRIITKRLAALGITPAQLQSAALIGLSNPASGMAKRFGAIEEDLGALWIEPGLLMYRGDREQFDLTREQLARMERKADHRSTSVLGGIAHVLLHVRLPDGSIRQIRLHTEGQWTMGRKRKAMDALAEAITGWQGG
jgi:hypothetical protein